MREERKLAVFRFRRRRGTRRCSRIEKRPLIACRESDLRSLAGPVPGTCVSDLVYRRFGEENMLPSAVGKRGGNTIDFVQQRERGLRVGKLETEIIRYLVEVGFRALGDFKREH